MIVAGISFPDSCPRNCLFIEDLQHGQNSFCCRCPVFVCSDGPYGPLVDPCGYRPDWAAEWQKFFENGERPHLTL